MKEIIEFLNSLYGLPGYALALIACLLVGYGCKISEWFPNKRIPLVMMPAGSFFNWLLALPKTPEQPLRLYIAQHIIIGALIGAIAWLVHDQLLKNIEEKIPLLGSLLKTNGKTNGSTTATTPPVK